MGRLKGRRVLALLAAAISAAVAVIGIAGADDGRTIDLGFPPTLTMTGDFNPKTLSSTALTPIAVRADGGIEEDDHYQNAHKRPPPLREIKVEGDKDAAIDVEGYPVCKPQQLSGETSTLEALANCRDAIVGRGSVTVEIAFADFPQQAFNSTLLVFNGGEQRGLTTFYIHAYLTAPVPAAIVSTVKVKRRRKGPYGTLAIIEIPEIVEGDASITSFHLKLKKNFGRDGKRVSVLSAKCRDGKLQANVYFRLIDGTQYHGEVIHSCHGTR